MLLLMVFTAAAGAAADDVSDLAHATIGDVDVKPDVDDDVDVAGFDSDDCKRCPGYNSCC